MLHAPIRIQQQRTDDADLGPLCVLKQRIEPVVLFDLGVVVIFRDREALEKFERDPRRRGGALDAMLQPLVRRYTVYNFANE